MTLEFIKSLENIREAEFISTFSNVEFEDYNSAMLEIGSGTGFQLRLLASKFRNVTGIDLPDSNYRDNRIANIIEYDGVNIPFKDKTVKYIFSSNVLEHIPHLKEFQSEMGRVLSDDGYCVHIVPTATWRFWAVLVHYFALPKRIFSYLNKKENESYNEKLDSNLSASKLDKFKNLLFVTRHGERGNRFTEFYYLSVNWWTDHFNSNGWIIKKSYSTGVFYSGHHFLGSKLSIKNRIFLAKIFGSACHSFILQKQINEE